MNVHLPNHMFRSCIVIAAITVLYTGARPVSASPRPHFGSPKSVFDKAWQHAPSTQCVSDRVCTYRVRVRRTKVRITVLFGSKDRANEIDVYQYPHPESTAFSRFLHALLPPGARRSKCKTEGSTLGGGPARECLYKVGKRQLLLIQNAHPCGTHPSGFLGWYDKSSNTASQCH
jgi:hypothetical protein